MLLVAETVIVGHLFDAGRGEFLDIEYIGDCQDSDGAALADTDSVAPGGLFPVVEGVLVPGMRLSDLLNLLGTDARPRIEQGSGRRARWFG